MPPSGSPAETPKAIVRAAISAGHRRSTRPLDRGPHRAQKTIRAPAQCAGFLSPGRQPKLDSSHFEARVAAGLSSRSRTPFPSRYGSRWRSESQESLDKGSREPPALPGSSRFQSPPRQPAKVQFPNNRNDRSFAPVRGAPNAARREVEVHRNNQS